MCILLVEDERMIRAMLAEELTAQGFEVREAESGDHASTLIAQASTTFSLLVTDIHMPGRLSGIDVARLLRVRCPDIPIIYMTARPDALNDIRPLGIRDVLLRKPFTLSELWAAVRRLLDQGDHRIR